MDQKFENIAEAVYSQGFCVCENFLGVEAVDALLAVFNEKRNFLKEAGIGKQESFAKTKSIRGDKILWLEKNENKLLDKFFFEPLENVVIMLNRRCFLGLNDHEFHFACYEAGTFYRRHKDIFSNDDSRKISVVLYLNKNRKAGDGGELVIYEKGEIKTEPKAGTLVVFESHIEHEVLTSNAERISITGWIKRKKDLL
jgi:SM-20-related protein